MSVVGLWKLLNIPGDLNCLLSMESVPQFSEPTEKVGDYWYMYLNKFLSNH
jgi:hypothetical protein